VAAVDDAIEDGVGECRVVEVGVPGLDRQLARDDGGARTDAVVEQFEQVAALGGAYGGNRKIVDEQQVKLGQLGQAAREAAVAVGDLQFVEEPGGAHVEHGEAGARGLVRESAYQPSFAAAGGPGDQQVASVA
jgi:hypothetical protein